MRNCVTESCKTFDLRCGHNCVENICKYKSSLMQIQVSELVIFLYNANHFGKGFHFVVKVILNKVNALDGTFVECLMKLLYSVKTIVCFISKYRCGNLFSMAVMK